jgi:hypothetical protein
VMRTEGAQNVPFDTGYAGRSQVHWECHHLTARTDRGCR